MKTVHKTVLLFAVILFCIWVIFNFERITGSQNGVIRFVLGLIFSLLVLIREKPDKRNSSISVWVVPLFVVTGVLLFLFGIIFTIHQFEWIGLLFIFYSCLRWTLPDKFTSDIYLSMFLFYWIHPLPWQVFGTIQLIMQDFSVKGAEWLLHCGNVRVWADGSILHTGLRVFGVPEACSGMRTATTVLLCGLGISVLFRFKWYETIAVLVIGLVQVLILNIIRISFMVFWSSRMPVEWGQTFLHDTLGIFLLITILLVNIEVAWWKFAKTRRKQIKKGIETEELEELEKGSMLPGFWRIIAGRGWLCLFLLLLVLGIAFGIFKNRPQHRTIMIKGVIDGLLENDLEGADKAITLLLKTNPNDRDLHSKKFRVLVVRDKFKEALKESMNIAPPLNPPETILKSWALMALGRSQEAFLMIENLPEDAKNLPVAAIILAEYGALQNDPDKVAHNIVKASSSRLTINRVRNLFPYLASREQWSTIVKADRNIPYKNPKHAQIALHANLKMNNISGMVQVLKLVEKKWSNNPSFLFGFFSLAMSNIDGNWESRYADVLKDNMMVMDADLLAENINYCFQLNRPDLVWQAYSRLSKMDSRDPLLYLLPAQFADVWFTFRKHQLGLEDDDPYAKIDLKSFYLQSMRMEPFSSFWDKVPLAEELAKGRVNDIKAKYLKLCLLELKRREKQKTLSRRMELMYPVALALTGRYIESHDMLDHLEVKYPTIKGTVLIQHAIMYHQHNQWQNSYETLVKYLSGIENPDLSVNLMLITALMNLNMGVCALEVAERAGKVFPESPDLKRIKAAIWGTFGEKEYALFILEKSKSEQNIIQRVRLLYDTGRIHEADKVNRSLNLKLVRNKFTEKQFVIPPYAELSIEKRWPPPLSNNDMEKAAKDIKKIMKNVTSSFIKDIGQRMIDWYMAHGNENESNQDKWMSIARNDMERVAVLHRLAMLLARQKEYDKAKKAIEEALKYYPCSPILRRELIALTGGDREVIRDARSFCSDDPDIWLAYFITSIKDGKKEGWIKEELERVINKKIFPAETIVRAGDFLFRNNMMNTAGCAAQYGINYGRNLLSAYVLGLRCALLEKDSEGALSCAVNAADNALDPAPFMKIIVNLKFSSKDMDMDMIAALEYLKDRFPDNAHWEERLGYAYIQKHDVARAFNILEPEIHKNTKKASVLSLLLAAEAARLKGEYGKSLQILENAYTTYPGNTDVLNNFIYYLAQDRDLVERAEKLLPALLDSGKETFQVLDTIAMVYLKSGKLKLAERYMNKALNKLDEDDYSALEINLNMAEILFSNGSYKRALDKLNIVRKNPKCSEIVNIRAKDLLEKIKEAMKK